MRIVLMYLGRKGAGPVYSLEFTRALLEQGVEILGIISTYSANRKDWEQLENVYGKNMQFQLLKISTFQNIIQCILRTANPFLFYKIIRSIKKFCPDAILATMIHPWHAILFSLLRNKILRIKIIHDVDPHVGENSLIERWLNMWDIRTTDKWIVLTSNSKNKLAAKGIANDDILVIPHAHFGFYNKYNSPAFVDKINYRIAFFGRICKYKGVDYLIKSYQQVVKMIPQLKLLIAGSGKLDSEIVDGIEVYNRWIDDNEVVDLLKNVDVVVLPYIEASQSGVIPLAFSLGKPVIVTNVGGLSEQVPKECGFLVPPKDIISLSEEILYFYEHPDKISEMGKAAYKYAYDYLDWKYSAGLFISTYEKK